MRLKETYGRQAGRQTGLTHTLTVTFIQALNSLSMEQSWYGEQSLGVEMDTEEI